MAEAARWRLNRSLIAAFHDFLAAAISFPVALWLRLGDRFYDSPATYLLSPLPVLFIAIFMAAAFSVRLYRGVWRYVSIKELRQIVQVASLTIIVFYAIQFVLFRLEGIPRSVPLIHWLILIAFLAAPRALYRTWRDIEADRGAVPAIPVLLLGSRDHAEQFLRALQRMPGAPYRVEAMIDDMPGQKGRTLHGVPIMGGLSSLEHSVRKLERRGRKPRKLLLSEDYLDEEKVSLLLEEAARLGIPLARLPRLTEFQEGFSGQMTLNPVSIEDLLGRSQNVHDREGMRRLIAGKVVLITGAGGSIGGELSRQVASYGPKLILFYDHSEYHLYEIDREIGLLSPGVTRRTVLGDVRDFAHLDALFAEAAPQMVFHAAAIKHVPMAEGNVVETLTTNVFGTENVCRAAIKHGAEAFVLISTDKAVNPANVMGAAKRLAEKSVVAIAAEQGVTGQQRGFRFTTVRFGNVLGSSGSVVPLFQKQLEAGGPLTVTHPEMERYFMTIREAVELVLESAVQHQASPGDPARLYVLDMGRPVKIDRLARQMIRLAGLKPGTDIRITYSGLRPGEKMTEELFYGAEALLDTPHASIHLARHIDVPPHDFAARLWRLRDACAARDEVAARQVLQSLIPEFQPVVEEAA